MVTFKELRPEVSPGLNAPDRMAPSRGIAVWRVVISNPLKSIWPPLARDSGRVAVAVICHAT